MNTFPFDRLLDWPFLSFLIIVIVLFRFRSEISERISSISELAFGDRAKISLGKNQAAPKTVENANSGEQVPISTQDFPADDIRLAYENLDWERHWPKFVSFALAQESGEIRRKVYNALARLDGTQANKLLNERPTSIDIEDDSFNQLQELKMIDITIEDPTLIRNIGAAIVFLVPLYFGISLIFSYNFLDFLSSIAPDWLGDWFVFVPIGLIFLFFFLLSRVFRNVLQPDATKKTVALTQTGAKFIRNDARPTLASYLRETGL